MSEFIFDGKKVVEPGVYSRVKSGVNNAPLSLTYGNVLVIDKDPLSVHGNGAGVKGQFAGGQNTLYSFDTITKMRLFLGGGLFFDLSQALFRPFGSASPGASTVYYVRALETVAATVSLTLDAGALVFTVRNEGLSGNGVLKGTELTKGYGIRMSAGVKNPAKFIFKFYRGSFTGLDTVQNQPYDGTAEVDSPARIIAQTPEMLNIEEFILWMSGNKNFQDNFELTTGGSATGALITADLTPNSSYQLFDGGTSAYSTDRMDDVLAAIKSKNINFIITSDFGSNAASTDNVKTATFLDTEMPDPAMLIVAGGNKAVDFETQSIASAALYNSQNVIVVHGGCSVIDPNSPVGLREKNVLYKAACVAGRLSGLAPQTPGTYKGINIAAEEHLLDFDERVMAIEGGVLGTVYDESLGFHRILQAVNTIQLNKNVVNSDGSTSSVSVARIISQLMKELKFNAIIDLLGDQEQGPNRATLDAETVRTWIISYLKRKEATNTTDNLIIDFQDVNVEADRDAWSVTLSFTPNYEVNKIFITATILDSANAN